MAEPLFFPQAKLWFFEILIQLSTGKWNSILQVGDI